MLEASASLSDQVARFFADSGPLADTLPSYEPRRGQLQFAQAVARALQSERPLLAEAGTGTGKTLAYLVPALLSGKQVLVSTATLALQEQVVREDVPLLERALGRQVSVAMLKGRQNYLCERRADSAVAAGSQSDEASAQLARVQQWRQTTQTGDRAELGHLGSGHDALWQRLTANGDQCLGRRCAFYDRCWLVIARNRAEQASVAVINHHLYFADASLAQRHGRGDEKPASLLPPAEAVIFDEAHELDDIAGRHFGAQVSQHAVSTLLGEVVDAAYPTDDVQLGRLAADAQRAAAATFGAVGQLSARDYSAEVGQAAPMLSPTPLGAASLAFHQHLATLGQELLHAEQSELNVLGRRIEALAHTLALAVGLETSADSAALGPLVRWYETGDAGTQLVARPLDVAAPPHTALGRAPGIFVSATLRVDGEFAHQRSRLGLHDAHELAIASPYEYERQASLYLPTQLPLPSDGAFDEQAAQLAAELVVASGGGAFVLCTSYRAVRQMQKTIEGAFAGRVLVQQRANKESMLKEFVHDGNAVLIATSSFWRGIDVRGHALRLVVIDRIPFTPPSDPLMQARITKVQSDGGDGFFDVQLPQAAILLQQGFGRLIRSHADQGMVALLDPRLRTRGYGKKLLASLPTCRQIVDHAGALQQLASLRRRQANAEQAGQIAAPR